MPQSCWKTAVSKANVQLSEYTLHCANTIYCINQLVLGIDTNTPLFRDMHDRASIFSAIRAKTEVGTFVLKIQMKAPRSHGNRKESGRLRARLQ